MTTPRLGAPELTSGQATPETTVNEQLRYAEQGAGAFAFKDRDLTAPPGSPVDGDCYLVKATATGAWAGKDGKIAFYLNTAWAFITPKEGMFAYICDENAFVVYDGTWAGVTPSGALLAANNLSDIASVATARTNLGLLRIIPFFFTTAPTASEVLAIYAAADAFTLPANMAGSQVKVGSNPAATFAIDVQNNGTTIATISIATSGTATLTTVSGTSKAIAAGDVIKFVAPSSADATIANVAINVKGTL